MKFLSKENPIEYQSSKYIQFSKYILDSTVKPNILWKYLREINKRDTSFLFLKTNIIYQEQFNQICKVIDVIMNQSALFIRILTPSILIFDLACVLNKYKKRILYSLPMKYLLTEKLPILKQLQKRGFLTYGMLEATKDTIDLLKSLNDQQCEKLWIEKGDKKLFENIIQSIVDRKLLSKIRFFVCIENLSLEDDQYFKMYPENIIYYNKE